MKMSTAMQVICPLKITASKSGFRISFERHEGSLLAGDYFPEKNEAVIASEQEAWRLAALFALNAPENYVNIYVIDASSFAPVKGYEAKTKRPYPTYKQGETK